MVTYAQLLNMDLSKLSTSAEECGNLASTLGQRGQQVLTKSDIPADLWEGADTDAASGLLKGQAPTLDEASNAFRLAKPILEELVEELEKAKTKLGDVQTLLSGTGIVVHADGTVVTPVVASQTEAERNDDLARTARDMIDQALFAAQAADDNASHRLSLTVDPRLGIDTDELTKTAEEDEPGPLDWLNGGWQEADRERGFLDVRLWDALTSQEWKHNFMGLLSAESKHGGQDGIKASLPTGENGPGVAVGGDPQRSLKFSVLDAEVGPVSGSLGSVEFNNSLIPSVEWGSGEDGRIRPMPKIGLPGVSVGGPSIGVDLNKLPRW